MCEILVKAIDHFHSDPEKDRTGAYKQGMPVVVMEDGHEWGKEERLPKFVVLKFPGVSVETMKDYITPHISDVPEIREIEEDPITKEKIIEEFYPIYRRRLWKFDFNLLSEKDRDKLYKDGELIIKTRKFNDKGNDKFDLEWDDIKSKLVNFKSGAFEIRDIS